MRRSMHKMFFWGVVVLVFLVAGCAEKQPEVDQVKVDLERNEVHKLLQAKSSPEVVSDYKKGYQERLQHMEKMKADLAKFQSQIAFYSGSRYTKKVALTFDDGPDEHFTPQILDILKKKEVPATFFVLGQMVKKYPDMLKKIDKEGHIIANHSWNHPQLTKIPEEKVVEQIESTNQIIQDTIGKKPLFMRPPYGAFNSKLENKLGENNMRVIYWDIDTLDWDNKTQDEIVQYVKKGLAPGSIILQHNSGNAGLAETVKALPIMIDHLKEKGFEIVTLDELLQIEAYE